MKKVIQISHEGKLSLSGQPIKDTQFGNSFFKSMYKKDYVCQGQVEGETVLVESVLAPLVVKNVESMLSGVVKLEFFYGYEEEFKLSKGLYQDDWSRLCGESKNEVPFVFSIPAQVKFLEKVVNPLSYDSFVYREKNYELEEWYEENLDVSKSKFWTERYLQEAMPWDLKTYHPCIDWTLPRLKLFKSKILVPGCGRGHDAAKLASLGHKVTGLDFSLEAIKKAKEFYGNKLKFETIDFFKFAQEHKEEHDIVFEHTFFCAISPGDREKLIKSWVKALKPGGYLVGVFFMALKRKGPPFGITEWELEQLLEKYFKIEYWGRLRGEEVAREGQELFIYAQKK